MSKGDNISAKINDVDESLQRLLGAQATIGASHAAVLAADDALLSDSVSLEARRSGIEDIDLGSVILELKTQEVCLPGGPVRCLPHPAALADGFPAMSRVLVPAAALPGFPEATTLSLEPVEGALGLYSLASPQAAGLRLFVLDAALHLTDYKPVFTNEQWH